MVAAITTTQGAMKLRTTKMEQWKERALKTAVHIDKRAQLPGNNEEATLFWDGGECTLKGVEKRVVQLLMTKTLYCASRMNMSACIDRLRHRHGVPIITYRYRDKDSGGVFGVYALSKRVSFSKPSSPNIGNRQCHTTNGNVTPIGIQAGVS